MRLNIRWKMILSILLPLLAVYGSMLGWDYYRLASSARAQLQSQVLRQAETIANIVNLKLAGIRQVVDSAAQGLTARSTLSESPVRTMLGTGMRPGNWIHATAVLFEPGVAPLPQVQAGRRMIFMLKRGATVASGGRLADAFDYTQMPWYQEAQSRNQVVWSEPFKAAFMDQKDGAKEGLMVCCAAPFLHDDLFAGVVVAFVRLEDLQDPAGGSTAERRPPPPGGPAGQGVPAGSGESAAAAVLAPLTPGQVDILPPPSPVAAAQEREKDKEKPRDIGFKSKADKDKFREKRPTGAMLIDPLTRAALGLAEDGYYIIDKEGKFLSHRDKHLIQKDSMFRLAENPKYKDLPGIEDIEEAGGQALHGGAGVVRVEGLGELVPNYSADDHHWIAFTALRATGWAFVTAIPEGRVMGPTIQRLYERAGFLAAGLVIIVGIVMIVSIRMSRPIEKLASAVGRLAAGDLGARIEGIRSRDEIGQLAAAFNTMTDQLKHHVQALTERSAAHEKIESELRIARQIQNDLLPRQFPPFPGRPEFDLHGVNAPARQVAGDFFDFFFTPGGLLTLVIADVSGKGVPAALLMAVTRTIIRNMAMENLSPAEILRRADQMLAADSNAAMFVTLFLAQYDPATGKLVYVNAGHPQPYRFNARLAPEPFGRITAPILGVESGGMLGPIEQMTDQLEIGQTLLLYTDGVIEARSPEDNMLTAAGLVAMLKSIPHDPVNILCAKIVAELDAFQNNLRADDITLVALRRNR